MSPKIKAKVRQQALRQMCLDGNGNLTKNARLIVAYLRKECNGDGRYGPPVSPLNGMIDPLAMARAIGRREIFDLLTRMLSVTLEERHNLEEYL